MNVLDLFSGIGGFSLGLERAGMRTVAFCEIDPYCRRVLAKHWPYVPIFPDITRLTGTDPGPVDVICGGFPCQDLSIAQGKARAGMEGKRSGLWSQFFRLICEIRPRFVIVENVPGLLSLGVGDVLKDLAQIGYDAEWQVISAASIGAPHIRERFWLVGYPDGDGKPARPIYDEASRLSGIVSDHWEDHTAILRMDDGLPPSMDRLRALGNAVVPQIPEIIGRAIMNAEAA